ncbi:MAG: 50S ribosomal protein L32 [Deltaproteobacteria bacterium]|nr:50S ribosomal protein L32 [Deltaproteobacteria bacterium]
MAVPKKRTSKQKKRQRRSHDALKAPNVISCPNCNEPVLPHHVCPSCGQYKGREVLASAE